MSHSVVKRREPLVRPERFSHAVGESVKILKKFTDYRLQSHRELITPPEFNNDLLV